MRLILATALTFLGTTVPHAACAQLVGSAFTYQGKLEIAAAPANGEFDFTFTAFDDAAAGVPDVQLGTVGVENVAVSDGIFSVLVDFGNATFLGAPVFLEIGVRDGASGGAFTTLAPRQRVTATPYALHAERIADDAVGPGAIATNAVGADEVASNAIGMDEIATGAVGQDEIATNAVGQDEIATNAVGADEIGPNAVGIAEVNPIEIQRRVAPGCPNANQSIKTIAFDGSVTCEIDDTAGTPYSAGTGISISGTTLSVDGAVVARKDAAAGNQAFDTTTLVLDYANNRVGIGNATPARELDVAGTVRGQTFERATPAIRYYYVTGAAFSPEVRTGDEGYLHNIVGSGYISGGTTPFTIKLAAPVNLPEGATVTELRCDVTDNFASGDLTLDANLALRDYNNGSSVFMASVLLTTSGAAGGVQSVSDTSIFTPLIDSTSFGYYLRAVLSLSSATSDKLAFYGCRIAYTSLTL